MFVGKLEPHEAGTIVKSIPGFDLPESYQTADPMHCEHCNTSRRRSATFIVKKNDELVQVGRGCLKDFLGHKSPEQYASYAEYLSDFTGSMGEYEGDMGCRIEPSYRTLDILEASIAAVKRDGFVGTSYETDKVPTKFTVFEFFNPPMGEARKYHVPLVITDADTKDAEATIAYVTEKAKTDKSEFAQNLNKFVSVERNEGKTFGYLAAAAMMFLKEQGALQAKKAMAQGINDDPIGDSGQKVILEVTVIAVHKYQRQSYHYYDSGMSQVLTMKTADGKLIKMFSSNMEVEKDDRVQLNGRLGNQEVEQFDKSPFKGHKMTMMAPRTRISVL